MAKIPKRQLKDDISIVLAGEAGQGIQSMEFVLTNVVKRAGYHVFGTKEYMSRVRGGSNSTEIRISSSRIAAFVDRIDILIPLDKDAITHLEERISSETIILGERDKLEASEDVIDVPLSKIAKEVGKTIYANTVAVGTILGLLKIDLEVLNEYLREYFATKGDEIIEKNIEAGRKGYEIGTDMSGPDKIDIDIESHPEVKEEFFLNGTEAVALGAIAGGCNFIGAYPMSPSTGVFTYLSQHAHDFSIVAEQVEDEISGMNMGIGAWYAGARALVSTSGGGFALMSEGLSLAGMTETPLVVHVAQRPGPATGLPTRTEQGDLQLVLYSGHGEFPRAIFAPGTLSDAFVLTQKAFNLADKTQSPIFVLTDQYFVDSYYNTPELDDPDAEVDKHFIETDEEYRRYRITDDGVSPRGIPGFGEGLVVLDSDEHFEDGHITESMTVRTNMVDKRRRKLQILIDEAIAPEVIGPEDYETLIVVWGSNYHVVREALRKIGRDDIAGLYFRQVYPLHPDTANYLKKAGQVIALENNATGQFANLIKLHTDIEIQDRILKYDGMPFSVEEVIDQIKQVTSRS